MRNSVRGYGYIRSIRIKQSFIKFTTYSASIIDALFLPTKATMKNLANVIARFLSFQRVFGFLKQAQLLVCSACDGDVKKLDGVRAFVVCRYESVL